MALSRDKNSLPSLKLSGVTFRIPITSVRSPIGKVRSFICQSRDMIEMIIGKYWDCTLVCFQQKQKEGTGLDPFPLCAYLLALCDLRRCGIATRNRWKNRLQ